MSHLTGIIAISCRISQGNRVQCKLAFDAGIFIIVSSCLISFKGLSYINDFTNFWKSRRIEFEASVTETSSILTFTLCVFVCLGVAGVCKSILCKLIALHCSTV
jgi:hypothetical protein